MASNIPLVQEWLPSVLVPFFTLSYQTAPPAKPDSFPHASYYMHGPLDLCIIVSFIAVMAVLRDVTRIFVLEPFARWHLLRDLRLTNAKASHRKGNGQANGGANGKTNGVVKGNGHAAHAHPHEITKRQSRQLNRSVIRFAEQGWSMVSYIFLWSLGLVRACTAAAASR